MTTIDPRQALTSLLRSEVTGMRQRTAARTAGPAASRGAERTPSDALVRRVQAIPPDAPQRQRRAVRVFLEAELVREFGPALRNDPLFPQMLDAVQEQMQHDARVEAAVQALGDWLLSHPTP